MGVPGYLKSWSGFIKIPDVTVSLNCGDHRHGVTGLFLQHADQQFVYRKRKL